MRTILQNGRIDGSDATDIVISDGAIEQIAPPGTVTAEPGDETIELGGQLVLPGFVDGHSHADKSLWGEPWVRRGSVAITMDQMFDDTLQQWALPQASIKERARRFLEMSVAAGSTTIRAYADVAPEIGLDGVHAMLELKQELAHLADIRVVAFPQLGILRKPGTEELLEEALVAGADAVGGLDPAGVDHDALKVLDIVFGLAEKYQVAADFHAHEDGELGVWLVDRIAERTRVLGMGGKVSMCDVFALAQPSPDQFAHLSSTFADAGIAFSIGVHGLLPVPDVKGLHEAGVAMCLGSDSSRSLWSPWGDGDILSRAMMMSYKSYWRTDDDLELAAQLATSLGRRALGLDARGVEVGASADLVVLTGEAVAEVVVQPVPRSLVFKRGVVVARDGALVADDVPASRQEPVSRPRRLSGR
ncbi:amidohydrolase family protein [Microbacterium sp.]|uniref:amidohydrolase family protein n=1 Tax=Microbacterium sp. TaxID=51671 RepID=UPI00281135DB|nr:amidohydrolase family protein [Microbacterium sp.]